MQGKPQQRELYVHPRADSARMLGVASYLYIKLGKPMRGQVGVPREWFREVCRGMQLVNLTQHPLSPCLFMAREAGGLIGVVSMRVGDLLDRAVPKVP